MQNVLAIDVLDIDNDLLLTGSFEMWWQLNWQHLQIECLISIFPRWTVHEKSDKTVQKKGFWLSDSNTGSWRNMRKSVI